MLRLHTPQKLAVKAKLVLDEGQSHYLTNVMRAKTGHEALLFNATDGEWRAVLEIRKKQAFAEVIAQTRQPQAEASLWLLFAPIKRGHGDFMIEKASELGATCIHPIITARTVVTRVPTQRYQAIATEAAEQCERLSVPEVAEPQTLPDVLKGWNPNRRLILCAEAGDAKPFIEAVSPLKSESWAVITGPEGGFSDDEFALLRAQPFVTPARLGPRILRADTAAIAGLTLLQALKGDWTP